MLHPRQRGRGPTVHHAIDRPGRAVVAIGHGKVVLAIDHHVLPVPGSFGCNALVHFPAKQGRFPLEHYAVNGRAAPQSIRARVGHHKKVTPIDLYVQPVSSSDGGNALVLFPLKQGLGPAIHDAIDGKRATVVMVGHGKIVLAANHHVLQVDRTCGSEPLVLLPFHRGWGPSIHCAVNCVRPSVVSVVRDRDVVLAINVHVPPSESPHGCESGCLLAVAPADNRLAPALLTGKA
mmetsp:Transcript_22095/g.84045  ORF Transcript_22095/g.84045 Transcript_22095/m.84045 type:complete len:234 (-) Transcript_22095:704-1405(-)